MGGYLVKVKYLGRFYDVKVSDEEINQKIEDFLKYNPIVENVIGICH